MRGEARVICGKPTVPGLIMALGGEQGCPDYIGFSKVIRIHVF